MYVGLEEYLESKNIKQGITGILESIVLHRPENPVDFIIDYLFKKHPDLASQAHVPFSAQLSIETASTEVLASKNRSPLVVVPKYTANEIRQRVLRGDFEFSKTDITWRIPTFKLTLLSSSTFTDAQPVRNFLMDECLFALRDVAKPYGKYIFLYIIALLLSLFTFSRRYYCW